MNHYVYHEYVKFDNEDFFTIVLLPEKNAKFPTVVCRSPYVKHTVNMSEAEVTDRYYNSMKQWLERGYAVVFQHCRGQGKSTGAFVPYIHEREDGLAFREWIRNCSFYNGELYLLGGSYTASLHYATAPFEDDIKGAVFEVQDSERYRLWYRNGQMRKGHANWHFELYKDKCGLDKCFKMTSFAELPLRGLSERVLHDHAEDFEKMLEAQGPSHAFWSTRHGGADAKDAVTNTHIPVLLTTGYNDFYVGGVFKMWEKMSENTKKNSALLVSPYNHGDSYNDTYGIPFLDGKRREAFGENYQIDWFDNIRKGTPLPFKKGVITYYRTFENVWDSDYLSIKSSPLKLLLGKGSKSFLYDPLSPPSFRCEGLIAEDACEREDMLTIYTEPFKSDTFIKGRMSVSLIVESNCPDTSFYVRISIKKDMFTYVLRHDITSLCYQLGDYTPNTEAKLDFSFDDYAFLIKKGECLRIDVSSTDNGTYVSHTNKKGAYHLQEETNVAQNKVRLDRSYITLPVEENH